MYFVDREKIEQTLLCLESHLDLYHQQPEWVSSIERKALERITHIVIEAILDVGNSMIDGFIMRDPGSYEDIIDILEDEKVVNTTHASQLKQVIKMRKNIVQEYLEIDHSEVSQIIKDNESALSSFSANIRSYLENELGPVSAFKN
ncbi:DUF86 domain-containing protein [Bacillus luteolus]|uniref:DUF86 domain-containing protein n=1 Tax=Litchfieldia luteola TaxID=682179 RepID=A0ABR9QGP8_9BACI|nr:DUF86 domain-containing protein [Cytobacillus luteolus]MBE4907409.1 DUF86 domain-containing protein [Cytobacillus luteolus]MBP1944175.1 uncharacterized protein YutE (UPF0331/DUF86 family) [Cytobacillus luteolus]